MTAIIYFGEILVASLLAMVLLATSQLRMSSDAVLFAVGVVAWTLAEYVAAVQPSIEGRPPMIMVLRAACSAISQHIRQIGVTFLTCMAIFAAERYFAV